MKIDPTATRRRQPRRDRQLDPVAVSMSGDPGGPSCSEPTRDGGAVEALAPPPTPTRGCGICTSTELSGGAFLALLWIIMIVSFARFNGIVFWGDIIVLSLSLVVLWVWLEGAGFGVLRRAISGIFA